MINLQVDLLLDGKTKVIMVDKQKLPMPKQGGHEIASVLLRWAEFFIAKSTVENLIIWSYVFLAKIATLWLRMY